MKENKKERGFLLTFWMVLLLAGGVLSAISYITIGLGVVADLPSVPEWLTYVFLFMSIANVIFVGFLFRWKRWAFYAFCSSAVLVMILNLYVGVGIGMALVGLAAPVILYAFMRKKWSLFE